MIAHLRNWKIYNTTRNSEFNVNKSALNIFKAINPAYDTISFSGSNKIVGGEYYFDPRSKLSNSYIMKRLRSKELGAEFEVIPISNLEKDIFNYPALQNHYFLGELIEENQKKHLQIIDSNHNLGKKTLKGLNKEIMPLVVHTAIQESYKRGCEGRTKIFCNKVDVVDYLLKLGFTPHTYCEDDAKIIKNLINNQTLENPKFILNVGFSLDDKSKIDQVKEQCIKDIDTNFIPQYTKYITRGPLYLLPKSDSFEIGLGKEIQLNQKDVSAKNFKANVTLDKDDKNSLIVENRSRTLLKKELIVCKYGETIKFNSGDEFTIGNTLYRYTPKGFRLLSEDSSTTKSLFRLKDGDFNLYQSDIGDCYFVAALYSLFRTYEGRELVYRMIEKVDENKYQVTFPGFPQDNFIVSNTEINSNSLTASSLCNGPDILELAFGKLLQKYQIHEEIVKDNVQGNLKDPYAWLNVGGNAAFVLYTLTGSKAYIIDVGEYDSIYDKVIGEEKIHSFVKDFITSLLQEESIPYKEKKELEQLSDFLKYPPSKLYKYFIASINLLKQLAHKQEVNTKDKEMLAKTLKHWNDDPYLNNEMIARFINSIELVKKNHTLNKNLNNKINIILKFLYSIKDIDNKQVKMQDKLNSFISRFHLSGEKMYTILGLPNFAWKNLDNTHYKTKNLLEILAKLPNRYIACCGSGINKENNFLTNHAFTIGNVNLHKNLITIVDPHDTSNLRADIRIHDLVTKFANLYVAKLPFKWND